MFIEGLPIPYATAQELRPIRHHRKRIRLFWQKSPKRRVMPTEFVHSAVTVLTNSLSQLLHLVDKFIACHLIKVSVHSVPPLAGLVTSIAARASVAGGVVNGVLNLDRNSLLGSLRVSASVKYLCVLALAAAAGVGSGAIAISVYDCLLRRPTLEFSGDHRESAATTGRRHQVHANTAKSPLAAL